MTRLLRSAALAAALVAASASPLSAEVVRVSDGGFAVSGSETLSLPPDQAWQRLVRPAEWWNADHSWSGDAGNLSLDPRAGGCFCEALADGGSVEHMRIVNAAPGKMLRMSGGLGPLQGESLTGLLTVTLEAAGEGTKLTWTYKVAGVSDIPFAGLAPAVDGVVQEQFGRLSAAN